MIAIGVDAHKRVHAALALDDAGTVLGSWRGANTTKGWVELRQWANQWPQPRHWGIEGTWNGIVAIEWAMKPWGTIEATADQWKVAAVRRPMLCRAR